MSSNGIEESMNRVLFFDDSSLELVCTYDLELLEVGLSVTTVSFDPPAPSSSSSSYSSGNPNLNSKAKTFYFAVGTAYNVNEEPEALKGRVLLFEVSVGASAGGAAGAGGRRVSLAAEKELKAAVYCLAAVSGRLAAGVGCKVRQSLSNKWIFSVIKIVISFITF